MNSRMNALIVSKNVNVNVLTWKNKRERERVKFLIGLSEHWFFYALFLFSLLFSLILVLIVVVVCNTSRATGGAFFAGRNWFSK